MICVVELLSQTVLISRISSRENSSVFLQFIAAVQHERGPRKPKLQHLQQMTQHHHHHHVMNLNSGGLPVSQGYNHPLHNYPHGGQNTNHLAHFNSFQQHSNNMLHHPQPLSFGPLLHPTPILQGSHLNSTPNTGHKFEHTKLSPNFDFPSMNSNFYKPFNHMQQLSPTNSKSTISIDSSSSTTSERLMSPLSTVDSNILTPPINTTTPNTQISAAVGATTFCTSSSSSLSSLATVTNATALRNITLTPQPPIAPSNGLLDILMSPDKCQVHWYEIVVVIRKAN